MTDASSLRETPTTDSFIKGMEGLGEVRCGQFVARYSPQSHNGANYVELAIVESSGRLRY